MTALWNLGRVEGLSYPALDKEVDCDVVVVGGGITGLSTALRLVETGRRVVVLEARRIGGVSTGGSTGNLYATFSQGLQSLGKKWDADTVHTVIDVRAQAINDIETNVRRLDIDCGFARRPLYFCASPGDSEKEEFVAAEWKASTNAGLRADLVDSVAGLPIPVQRALRIENQAQFNPLQYVQGLAQAAEREGALLFENSAVIDVDAGHGRIATRAGLVNARDIVLATHTPKGINLLQAEMEPYREYGVAAALSGGDVPEGICWILDGFHSVRGYSHGGRNYLVVVGEKHETGHGNLGGEYYENLKRYGREHFAVGDFSHAWSAQQYRAADLLPYIGHSGHSNVYVATGFAADGLVWGEAAALIISDQILGRANESARLFNPRRFTPVKSGRHWGETNMKVGRHLLTDRFKVEKLHDLAPLAAGQGKVVNLDGHKIAVYRRPDNSLSMLSPVCPHMKCYVNWNAADATWDCPCHGSRFDTDGSVIEGPALCGLEKVEEVEPVES